jgi:hypothetical protein
MGAEASQGIFSPIVLATKAVLGKEELNKLRAKVIAEHSKVISKFVETSESKFGRIALARMFAFADTDGNGELSKEEVAAALKALGFSYLKEAQIEGIFNRADVDQDGVVDFEEFINETPKTYARASTSVAVAPRRKARARALVSAARTLMRQFRAPAPNRLQVAHQLDQARQAEWQRPRLPGIAFVSGHWLSDNGRSELKTTPDASSKTARCDAQNAGAAGRLSIQRC